MQLRGALHFNFIKNVRLTIIRFAVIIHFYDGL